MWLTATDAGLAACFFGIPIDRIASFRSAFAVPPQYTPTGAIRIAYDDEPSGQVSAMRERARAMRKPLAQNVHRGRWNLPCTEQPSEATAAPVLLLPGEDVAQESSAPPRRVRMAAFAWQCRMEGSCDWWASRRAKAGGIPRPRGGAVGG